MQRVQDVQSAEGVTDSGVVVDCYCLRDGILADRFEVVAFGCWMFARLTVLVAHGMETSEGLQVVAAVEPGRSVYQVELY